ncbi:diguanylate cyclase [Gallaecimonas sp. GXIMD4217]|uniref:GGDEF domain-containing protein n=1 Tax=Gallaecimonas sp. GXIMD4217 TaxID=3131927 RepID=UPI00311B1642
MEPGKREGGALALLELRQVLAASPICTVLAQAPDGELLYCNPAVYRFRGDTDLPLTGSSIHDSVLSMKLFRPDGTPIAGKDMPLARTLGSGEVVENEEIIIQLDDGAFRWLIAWAAPIRDNQGQILAGMLCWQDMTGTANERMGRLAHHYQQRQHRAPRILLEDPTTKVLNRQGLLSRAGQRLSSGDRRLTLLVLDIDHFGLFNETHGQLVGDRILVSLASCIQGQLRQGDIFGRLGADDFVVILTNCSADMADSFVHRIHNQVAALTVAHHNMALRLTICSGMSPMTTCERDIFPALRRADLALLEAKSRGRNQHVTAPIISQGHP